MADRERRSRKEDSPEVEETPVPKKKSGIIRKLLMGLIVLVILGGAGAGGWIFYQHRAESSQSAVQPLPKIGALWSMGTLIVNLLDDDGERYLKASIELELSSPDVAAELDILRPRILDGILDLLSSKYYREIVGFEGKQHLRDEITLRVNNYLSRGRISNVYFTDFVIQ